MSDEGITDSLLSRLLKKKHDYERERNALRRRVEEIDRKIVEIQAEYNTIHNKRVLILKLPTEVTCMIFQFTSRNRLPSSSPEVVVSHVCRSWRSIALAYPCLWTSFYYSGYEGFRIPHDKLDAYLERSATQKLDLCFDLREIEEGDVSRHLTLLDKVIPHVARWRHVTMLSDSDAPILDILPKLQSLLAPNLEHFSFCADALTDSSEHPSEISTLEPTVFMGGAPKLKILQLDTSITLGCLPPLSNITTLDIENNWGDLSLLSLARFCDVLSLPSLEDLSLDGNILDPESISYDTFLPPISMSKLKHLRFYNSIGLCFLLPSLRAPLLETLMLKDEWVMEEFGTAGSIWSEPYVFPSLKVVTVMETTIAVPNGAYRFAQMTASATDLVFADENLAESFFAILQDNPDVCADPYWTKVTRVTCCFKYLQDVAFLGKFLDTRRKNGLVLRIFDSFHDVLRREAPSTYEIIKAACTFEIMDGRGTIVNEDIHHFNYKNHFSMPLPYSQFSA